MPLLLDAVGQSLSTRPDIIGAEIAQVRNECIGILSVSYMSLHVIILQVYEYTVNCMVYIVSVFIFRETISNFVSSIKLLLYQ